MAVLVTPNPARTAFVPFDYGVHSTAIGTTRRDTDTGPFQRANVVLFDQSRMLAIREMWSDSTTGQWQFHNLRPGKFFVVSPDPLGLKNGEIVTDIVVPAP